MPIRSTSLAVVAESSASLAYAEADPATALLDNAARRIRYLRISVTDRCNFRCTYCMPDHVDHDVRFVARDQLLTFEEIEQVVAVFAELGVRKIRLTGGEPTVRAGIVDLVERIAKIQGIEQVVMTSNGHLLERLAKPLADAGLTGVHVSVDTLDPARFAQLTGRGLLLDVEAGIAAASAVGILQGINTVALRGQNDHEVAALCEFAWRYGAVPRFIEHMPMSQGAFFSSTQQFSALQIRSQCAQAFGPLSAVPTRGRDAGPARYWQLADGRKLGIISAMTEHFCDDCNRLRLTAEGSLHACLGYDDAVSLRDVIRAGGTRSQVTAAIASAVNGKRDGHVFTADGGGGPKKHMISIGG